MRLILKPFVITGGPYIISHGCHQQLEHSFCPGAAPHSESRKPRRKRLCLPAEHQRGPGHGLPWSQRRHGSSDGSGQTGHCLSCTLHAVNSSWLAALLGTNRTIIYLTMEKWTISFTREKLFLMWTCFSQIVLKGFYRIFRACCVTGATLLLTHFCCSKHLYFNSEP